MKIVKATLLDAVTATTVSKPLNVKNAKKVTFSFKREGHVSGSVVFSIQAALDYSDGADFVPFVNMISNDPNNHSQTLERNITVELTANKHTITALDLEHFNYEYIQVKAVATGTGTNTCKVLIQEV